MGKLFGKAFRISELDERKDRWVVEQDFQANFRGSVTWFLPFFSDLLDRTMLILVWFENSPWTLKLTTSQAVEVTWIYMKQFRAVRGRIDWCADKKRRNNFLAWMTANGSCKRYDSLAGEGSYTNTYGTFTLLFLAVFLASMLPNPLSQKYIC